MNRSMSAIRGSSIAKALFALVLVMSAPLSGCAHDTASETDQIVAIGSLKGPTSIGLAAMMDECDEYEFVVAGTPDEIVPMLSRGELDIALIPANLAATLYQKTEGGVQVIGVNTLGVLYAVSQDASIEGVADLAGRTVYMTGKGTVPEYSFAAILTAAGIDRSELSIEFKSEPSEVAALIAVDPEAVGILPQPYVTAAVAQEPSLSVVLSLTDEWEKATGSQGSFVTGVTVARTEFIENNPESIELFLDHHLESTTKANEHPSEVAHKVVDLGIVASVEAAETAIPSCNLVCLTGAEMKEALNGYLVALHEENPASVGGSLPDESFYYLGQNR